MDLKELREKTKLSQAAFAKTIGVSPSAVASIESGRMKASAKIIDAVKNTHGEVIEPEVKKTKPAEKKDKPAVKKAKPAAKKTKAAPKTKKKAEKAAPAPKKALPRKTEIIIQSPLGGEITPDAILARLSKDVDSVYVRVDQNKAYWVKGEEYGSVDLW